MLVLSRNVNSSIVIGDMIVKITILKVSGEQVKLGIDAPSNISVHREEIYNKIKLDNEQSINIYPKHKNIVI